MNLKNGKVYLVGAGPGDWELITIKALEIIKTADVLVYDRLIDKRILDEAKESAELINVGKNSGFHPIPQEEINEILISKAKENKTVARIKGGDPYLFGRGGEEVIALLAEGIDFESVPGVTSAISVPAYAGIPVTHRGLSQSLHIFTGHAKNDLIPDIDYELYAKTEGTLVFLMSVATIGRICEKFIKNGMNADRSCAVIESGTLPSQRKILGTVKNINDLMKRNKIKSPAIIVIGEVCKLSESLDWFSDLPLKNAKILVTRPKDTAGKLSKLLKDKGADVAIYPCIKTKALDFSFVDSDWIIFTSARGVKYFFEKLYRENKDSRIFSNTKFAVIGTETAKELLTNGIKADFVPKVFDGYNLSKEFINSGLVKENEKITLYRAKDGSEEIFDIFKENNFKITDIAVYETINLQEENLNLSDFDFVTFTSKSCVSGFVKNNPNSSGIKALCIGNETAKKAREYGMEVFVSEKATIVSMAEKLAEVYNK